MNGPWIEKPAKGNYPMRLVKNIKLSISCRLNGHLIIFHQVCHLMHVVSSLERWGMLENRDERWWAVIE
jgi:hypothetical protein